MVGVIFIIVLLSCGLKYKDNNYIFGLLVLSAIMIMGLNTDNPDYDNYVDAFEYAEYPYQFNIFEVIDIGFKLLQAFVKSIGIDSYEKFRFLLSVLLFIIFGATICKYCKYKNLFIAIYIFFYIALD